ncbi:MAG: hypothetical protein FJY75_10580 [Candidatus Eisenbacteria bacterium]|uniref:Cohesin domain-containing protein n=1 Tax=Eiseniibacteriota bacterium TaxID=2212470 RepID=A0A937XDG2_UNCEI|nr:hypothetical protein [Candidatus Eisenbacteria bacterium]
MNVKSRMWWVLLTAALLLLGARAPGAVVLGFEPDVVYATHPETFVVSVMASDVEGMRGYQLDIGFDPGLVDFVAAQRGALFENYAPPFGLYWSVTDGGYHVAVECLILPEGECAVGPGEILRLTFAALEGQGESALGFVSGTVRDCQGVPIQPLVMLDGQIVIGPVTGLFFDPDPKYVWGPGPFEVSLSVGPVDSLRGFQVYLSYDPASLVFEQAVAGELLEPPPPLWWYVTQESPSLVRIEGVVLGPGQFVTGPGELAKVRFTSLLDPDTTEIVFETWHLWDVNTVELYPVAVDDGLVITHAALQGSPDHPMAGGGAPRLLLRPVGPRPGPAAAFHCSLPSGEAGAGRSAVAAGRFEAEVLAVSGRFVASLVPRPSPGGAIVAWDGRDASGRGAAPGIYFLTVRSGAHGATERIVLVR